MSEQIEVNQGKFKIKYYESTQKYGFVICGVFYWLKPSEFADLRMIINSVVERVDNA